MSSPALARPATRAADESGACRASMWHQRLHAPVLSLAALTARLVRWVRGGDNRWHRSPQSVTFETTVAASGNNTGIVVPDEVIEQLRRGKRPPVLVNVNGYEYRNTVAVMGGRHMISIQRRRPQRYGPEGAETRSA